MAFNQGPDLQTVDFSHSELLWSSLSLREVLIHWLYKGSWKSPSKCEVSQVQLATSAAPPQRHSSIIQSERDQMIAELKQRFTSNLVSIEEGEMTQICS